MIVENVSFISKEDAHKVLLATSKRNIYFKFLYAGALALIGVAVTLYGFLNYDTIKSGAQWWGMGLVFLLLGIAYGIYIIVLLVNADKDVLKKNPDVCTYGVTYNYRFREQGCDLVLTSNNKKTKISYKYDEFKRVFEYEDRYEIRVGQDVTLYVLKASFKDEKMVQFFKKNLSTNKKLKFINRMKKEA